MSLSGREETQRRMLANKQQLKNPKLASMTTIANRSPQNRGAITATSPPLPKKRSIEGSQKAITSPRTALSPRNNVKEVSHREVTMRSVPKNSSVTVDLPNSDHYEGNSLEGTFQGQGAYWFNPQQLKYEGEFDKGKQHGYGVLIDLRTDEVIYEGSWVAGRKEGEGRYTYGPEQYYNGDWQQDEKHGSGVYHFPGGIYNGQWSHNKREGKGSLKLSSGAQFRGTFENNQFVRGLVKYPNGDEYSGQMRNNRRTGQEGSYVELATKMRYKGGWLNDRRNGTGTLTYQNGDQLSGTFMDGQLNEQYVVSYRWRQGTVFEGWLRGRVPQKGKFSRGGQQWQI